MKAWNPYPCNTKDECNFHNCTARYWCGRFDCPHCEDKYCPTCLGILRHYGLALKCKHKISTCQECKFTEMSWERLYYCNVCKKDFAVLDFSNQDL